MPTVVLDLPRHELEQLIERRSRLGIDRWDEMWDGVLHVNATPSTAHALIGEELRRLLGGPAAEVDLVLLGTVGIGTHANDYRSPDLVLLRRPLAPQWHETAALVVEILSPGDESYKKLPYYADRGVGEVLIVDPHSRSVEWLSLRDDAYRAVPRSGLIAVSSPELESAIEWPPVDGPIP